MDEMTIGKEWYNGCDGNFDHQFSFFPQPIFKEGMDLKSLANCCQWHTYTSGLFAHQ
jgi:hypothetical protein